MANPNCIPDCQLNPAHTPGAPASSGESSPQANTWLSGGGVVVESDGRIISANDALALWLSSSPSGLQGKSLPALLGRRCPQWEEAFQQLLRHSAPFDRLELSSSSADGKSERLTVESARHGATFFLRLESATPSISELEEMFPESCWARAVSNGVFQRMLRSESQLQNLMNRWPGIIFSQRPDFSFVFVSPKIEELTGVSAAEWRRQSKYFWEVVHEADAEALAAKLRAEAQNGQGLTSTYRIRHTQTGRVTYLWEHRQAVRSNNGLLLGFEGIWLDITRQTIAERRLLNMSWRENLATLTLGLAHDFCNVMTGIVGLSETFEASLEEDSSLRGGLSLIRTTAIEASQLAHRIRQLHQGLPGEKNYQDLNERVTSLVEVLGKVLPRRIRVRTALAAGQLPIYVDAVQLQQVIVNLALNAADAMPKGGELTFRTGRQQECPATEFLQGTLPASPLVSLSVQDTGTGIPKRFLASIFDPFFTSKPLGKGSGLGLYNARLFAEQHGTAISVETKEGAGTTFRLWFPETDFTEAQTAEPAPSLPERQTLLVTGAHGEPFDHLVTLLRQNGYYVVPAADEAEAVEALHEPQNQFSGILVLCTDSRAQGLSLCQRIRAHNLPLKTVLTVLGCNHDEVDNSLMEAADAVVPFDLPPHEFLSQLKRMFEPARG